MSLKAEQNHRGNDMLTRSRRIASVLFASFLVYAVSLPASAADPEIDALLKGPVGKDWVTSGGNLTNQRYSTLKQINTENVLQLIGTGWCFALRWPPSPCRPDPSAVRRSLDR